MFDWSTTGRLRLRLRLPPLSAALECCRREAAHNSIASSFVCHPMAGWIRLAAYQMVPSARAPANRRHRQQLVAGTVANVCRCLLFLRPPTQPLARSFAHVSWLPTERRAPKTSRRVASDVAAKFGSRQTFGWCRFRQSAERASERTNELTDRQTDRC